MKVTQPDGSTKLTYLHKDRLGSVDTITDGDKVASLYNLDEVVLEQRSFNVFGKARTDEGAIAPDGSEGNGELGSSWTPRGFTGHEHLDDTGLIHMNGRAYDPDLGRFMSVDPFITFPDNGQSLNPYSYVMNNPLKYTDPSGYVTNTTPVKRGRKDGPPVLPSTGAGNIKVSGMCSIYYGCMAYTNGNGANSTTSGEGSNKKTTGSKTSDADVGFLKGWGIGSKVTVGFLIEKYIKEEKSSLEQKEGVKAISVALIKGIYHYIRNLLLKD